MAGFKLTQKNAFVSRFESAGRLSIRRVFFGPWSRACQAFVNTFHVLHTLSLKPFSKRVFSASDKHSNAILPSRTPAKDAAVLDACFASKRKGFVKCAVTYAGGKKQEGLCGCCCGTTKNLKSFGARVHENTVRSGGAFNIGHSYRHADLQDIHQVTRLREFLHGACKNPGLETRKGRTIFVNSLLIRNDF